jgi:hypothetical protein
VSNNSLVCCYNIIIHVAYIWEHIVLFGGICIRQWYNKTTRHGLNNAINHNGRLLHAQSLHNSVNRNIKQYTIPSQHVTAKHTPSITLLGIYLSESLCIENKQRLIDICWPEICIAINLLYPVSRPSLQLHHPVALLWNHNAWYWLIGSG